MSYILEALNKSQREHARGSVPTLQGQAIPARPAVRRIGPLVIALLLGAVMALLIAGYLFRGQDFGAVPSPAIPKGDVRSGSPGSDSQPAPIAVPSAMPATEPEPLPVSGTEPGSNRPDRPSQPEAGPNGSRKPPASPRPEAVRQPPAKVWGELPADIRRTIGNLVLNIHVYSERPEKRFVFINQREYGEGDVLQEGPVLEAIGTGGLILSFNDERFRLDM